jgi:DNA-binding transcriptional MerR regulator
MAAGRTNAASSRLVQFSRVHDAYGAWMAAQQLPYWPINPSLAPSAWLTFQLDLARSLFTIFPAAVLWGASFPLAVAAAARDNNNDRDDAGVTVGRVYAANTLGAIGGSLLTGLVFVPLMGTHRSVCSSSFGDFGGRRARANSSAGARIRRDVRPRLPAGPRVSRSGLGGLLCPEARLPSGYRLYTERAVARIRIARQLQGLGMTLEAVGDALRAHDDGGSCDSERWRLAAARDRVDTELARLTAVRAELDATLARCAAGRRRDQHHPPWADGDLRTRNRIPRSSRNTSAK